MIKNSRKVVLVIEDNESNMKLFHALLDAHGYDVLQATNGLGGLQMAREHRPNVIIMDMQLPDISGLEVTRWLKNDENLKSIPIIAVTAFAMDGDKEKFLNSGCDAYISKPISITKFLQALERVVAESEPNSTECELETA